MCAQLTRERASLLLEVAHLYWDEGLDQARIASRMGYSRPTVSRMLSEARRHGVVTVTVSHPIERLMALEEQLAQAFGLKEARVAEDRADGADAGERHVAAGGELQRGGYLLLAAHRAGVLQGVEDEGDRQRAVVAAQSQGQVAADVRAVLEVEGLPGRAQHRHRR